MLLVSMQLLREHFSDNQIKRAFSSFSCRRDEDIEMFAKRRAMRFEKASKSRTYLFVDDAVLSGGVLEFIAFFTMAPQILHLPEGLTPEQIKELDGISDSIHGKRLSSLPVVLIGQLARADEYSSISGDEMLSCALGIATEVHHAIGGRIVMVDVKTQAPGLIHFYERNGFRKISGDLDTGLSQMIYMLGNR